MTPEILILDFGSQFTQLIARRIREQKVYCEIHPYNKIPIWANRCKGLILSGSPFSVNEEKALKIDLAPFLNKVPILGICYGAQLLAAQTGGKVESSDKREYGKAEIVLKNSSDALFEGIENNSQVWMSHGDTIMQLPEQAELLSTSNADKIAAFKLSGFNEQPVYGLQFHPEVTHTLQGTQFYKNFAFNIAKCDGDWNEKSFIDESISQIKQTVGNDTVIMGISGGVDSSVAATLIHKAIGKQLVSIFVDNGLLRKDEYEKVLEAYKNLGLNVKGVDARQEFYEALKDIVDPELKRKAIGKTFIDVFDKEAKKVENAKWLGQGTIYPDVIESVSVHGPAAKIKSHHNVGGLPEKMDLKVLEPLNRCFKDEVRQIGYALDLPKSIVGRHPFPGPGLAIRILGDITETKVNLLQKADAIFINCLKNADWYDKVWQAGVILLPVQSVGVMGDERTYENVVALRAVTSVDGMTADWSRLPYELMAEISTKIINEVKGINRVVYDISTKPPATIEWE